MRLPRVLHAFTGANPRDRRTFLETAIPLIVSGALAEEGQHPSAVRGRRAGAATQAEIAATCGNHRVTLTKRLSKLCAAANGYEQARQRRDKVIKEISSASTRLEMHRAGLAPHPDNKTSGKLLPPIEIRCVACDSGMLCTKVKHLEKIIAKPVREIEHYMRPIPTAVLYRRRRVGMANRYGIRMGQRLEEWLVLETSTGAELSRHLTATAAARACDKLQKLARERGSETLYQVEAAKLQVAAVRAPSLEELRQSADGSADWWEAATRPDGRPNYDQADGYQDIDRWIWDARICDPLTGRPIGALARLLMTLYQSRGLLEEFAPTPEFPEGKAAGFLRIKQAKVAELLGCELRTVYRLNCLWERLGVIRVVSGHSKKKIGCKGQEIFYLPFRTLTEAECDAERERMARRVREVCASEYARNVWGAAGALRQAVEALAIHGEHLERWRGSERKLHTLWRAVAESCDAAGVLPDFYTRVLPIMACSAARGAPPPEPGWFDSQPPG